MVSRTAISLSIILLAFSCEPRKCCGNVDTIVEVMVKDKSGNNLLSSSTPGYYKPDEIKIFYLENGVKTLVIAQNAGFDIKGSVLMLTPYPGTSNGETTTYIQWRANDEDVIETTIDRGSGSYICTKVKCNGKLKYNGMDSVSSYHRLVTIIK